MTAARELGISAVVAVVGGLTLAVVGAGHGVAAMALVVVAPVLVMSVPSRPWLGVAVAIAAIPVGLRPVGAGLQVSDVAAVASFALVVFAALWNGERLFRPDPAWGWAWVLIASAALAAIDAADIGTATKRVVFYLAGLLLAMAVVAAVRHEQDLWLLASLLVVVAGGLAIEAAIDAVTSLGTYTPEGGPLGRPVGVFTQPNQLAGFMAGVLPVAAVLGLAPGPRWRRVIGATASVVIFAAVVLALSRGAWIATFVAAGVLLTMLPPARRAAVAVGLAVSTLAILSVFVGTTQQAPAQVDLVRERLDTFSTASVGPNDARDLIWREGWRQFTADPLTGQGPANFAIEAQRPESRTRWVGADHAHNLLLQIAAEAGLPAVLAAIGLGLHLSRRVFRAARRRRADPATFLLVGVAASLAGLLGHGLVDFPLANPLNNTQLWLLLGLLIGCLQPRRIAPRPG